MAKNGRIWYALEVGLTWCEVIVKMPDGQRYSGRFKAKSVLDAAAQMYTELRSVRINREPVELAPGPVFEVRPVYRVKKEAVAKWVKLEEARHIRTRARHKR